MNSTPTLITYLGLLLQFVAALLLGGLFFLLRVHASRRRYFMMWGSGWLLLAAAVGALAVRFRGPPEFLAMPMADEQTMPVAVLYFVFVLGKLGWLTLLVAGTERYVRGTPPTPLVPVLLGLSVAYSLVAVFLAADLTDVVVWHAALAVPALAWCAQRLLRLPLPRHGVGTGIVAVVTLFMALLWAMSFVAFNAFTPGGPLPPGLFGYIIRYSAYFDLLLHMMLASGMIVLLMEEAKREVDDAHLYDSVTATLNRRAFAESVGLESARSQFGTVMMLDLDDLKSVNDAYGHTAGDALLRHLADAVRAELRPSDRIYRWGGDEFLLVLPGADVGGAHARLRTVLSRAASLHLGADGHEVRLGVSMGSAPFASIDDLAAAIDAADAQMYHEKNRRKAIRASGLPAA
jgi:diguanylate cyclase (GGDEF)-like protein